jgi:uncharacterized protein (DUF58 family)
VGEGLTFSDYRRYSPGDEPGRVDWKLYARTEELYVKEFEEERQATVHVLLDRSRSMDYGAGPANKFEFGAKLGLGFAYLTAREHDEFRFSVVGDGVERLDGGRSSRGEVLALADRCNDLDPAGEAAFADALRAYAGTIRSKSLVVVVGDFLVDRDALEAGLGALADNDVVCAHLLAPGERDPPATGDTVFEAVESDRSLRTYFGRRLAGRYRERLADHVEAVAATCQRVGARHERVDTGGDFFETFGSLWFGG